MVLITKRLGYLVQKTRRVSSGLKAVSHLLFAICLCACLPERFRHEKYDCSASLSNISNITLNKVKVGNYAKITTLTNEAKTNITQIDQQTARLVYKNMQIKINRKTGEVTLIEGTRYRKAKCKKTVFTM